MKKYFSLKIGCEHGIVVWEKVEHDLNVLIESVPEDIDCDCVKDMEVNNG